MRRIICFALLFICAVTLSSVKVSADDASSQAWPIEVKCIPDPVLPPNGWTYPGTILMSGYAGIHGIQADWETPHVVAYFRKDANGDYPLYGGQLSPDAHWYAAPIGETWAEISFNNYWDVRGVRLYDLSGENHEFPLDLQTYRDLYRYDPVAWGYLPVEWYDPESLVIGGLLFHPLDNQVELAIYDTVGSVYDDRFFSPDFTRVYGATLLDANGQVVTYQTLKTFDYSYAVGLARLDDPKAGVVDLGKITGLSWRRDSAGFVAEVEADNQLVLYDHDGNRQESVFNLGEEGVNFHRSASGRNDLRWSPDSQQYSFSYSPHYPEQIHVYIASIKDKIVTDTCLNPISQPVWSPDGKMLAYLALARENLKIIVVDLETWKSYDMGRMSGRYALSGSPEMVGWRE
ncbi:MAG: WD40 repeat domain-containing protein [Chloroflexota bacterium]